MKRIICTLLIFIMTLPTFVFADYKASDWATEEVSRADELGLIPSIMEDGDLTENITRAEFTGIAVELMRALTGNTYRYYGGKMADVENTYYENYIRCAYYYGITNGTDISEDGTVVFSPDAEITSEQLATMLARVVKRVIDSDWVLIDDEFYPFDISGAVKFADDTEISSYAYESVYYMSKKGIIKGMDETNFAPLDTATIEQAVAIAMRIYDDMHEEPVMPPAKTKEFESYIGMSPEEVTAKFGEPYYAFCYNNWHYTFYAYDKAVLAFENHEKLASEDGTPIYPDDASYKQPEGNVKGVLTYLNAWLGGNMPNYTFDEIYGISGLKFTEAREHWTGGYYHFAYDSETAIQYMFVESLGMVEGNTGIFIQDYSHNVALPEKE